MFLMVMHTVLYSHLTLIRQACVPRLLFLIEFVCVFYWLPQSSKEHAKVFHSSIKNFFS